MIGKIFFAILMLFAVLVCLAGKQYSMALFFAIVLGIMIWLINRRPKQEIEL